MKERSKLLAFFFILSIGGCKDIGSPLPSLQPIDPPPVPEPFWKQVGLSGEDVRALAANADSMVIAAVNAASGTRNLVFQTTNNGETWSELRQNRNCYFLAVDMSNGFYSVSSNFFTTDLHRSTDNGTTWIALSIPSTNIGSICFDTSNAIFLGDGGGDHSPGGVRRSTDGGQSWLYADTLTRTRTGIVCMAANSENVFAATRKGIFRKDDDEQWRLVNSEMTDAVGFSFISVPNRELFLGTFNRGLMKSNDNGVSWQSTTLNEPAILSVMSNPQGTIIAVDALLRFPGKSLERIYISTNFGQTWKSDTTGLHQLGSSRTLAVTSNGYVFVGTTSGVYRNAKPLR